MALAADHSDMPTDQGWMPDREPRFLPLVGEMLVANDAQRHAEWLERHADDDRQLTWLSRMGACARLIGYEVRGDEPSNPIPVSGLWPMALGTLVHDTFVLPALERLLRARYGDENVRTEAPVNMLARDDELVAPVDGRIDLFVVEQSADMPTGHRTVVEVKTINGMGFKGAVGSNKGGAEGPKMGAVRQGAVAARHYDADELVLLYLAMENISAAVARRLGFDDLGRFGAEWTLTREQYVPIADAEISRQHRIHELLAAGQLPPRSMPDIPPRARVTDPSTGLWTIEIAGEVTESGKAWQCPDYCSQRDRCIADGAS